MIEYIIAIIAFTSVVVAIVLYLAYMLRREVEHWRQRKHAEFEIERINARAMAELNSLAQREASFKSTPCAPCTTKGAVVTEYERKPVAAVPSSVLDQMNQYRCPICGTVGGRCARDVRGRPRHRAAAPPRG